MRQKLGQIGNAAWNDSANGPAKNAGRSSMHRRDILKIAAAGAAGMVGHPAMAGEPRQAAPRPGEKLPTAPGKKTRTITLEEHFATPEVLGAILKAWAGDPLVDLLQANRVKLLDVGSGRIGEMDATQIDVQVLSLMGVGMDRLDPADAAALSHDANDRLAAIVQAHPDRFAGLADLPLQQPEKAAAELERCVRELKFKGALINGATNGVFLDHPRYTPVLEAAQALDVPIYLHPGLPPAVVRQAYYSELPRELGFVLSLPGWGWHVEAGMHSMRMVISGLACSTACPSCKSCLGTWARPCHSFWPARKGSWLPGQRRCRDGYQIISTKTSTSPPADIFQCRRFSAHWRFSGRTAFCFPWITPSTAWPRDEPS